MFMKIGGENKNMKIMGCLRKALKNGKVARERERERGKKSQREKERETERGRERGRERPLKKG